MSFFTNLFSYFRSKYNPQSSHTTYMKPKPCPPITNLSTQTLVFDVEGGLLRSSSTFPYFMLVALEGGGLLRGLLLLFLYPVICCLSQELAIRVMVMVSFCGLRKDTFLVGKAVLPKFLLEDVGLEGFDVMRRGKRRVCVSRMPRVMVEWFLKEYLEVEVVVGRELKEVGRFYSGLMEEKWNYCTDGDKGVEGGGFIGVVSSTEYLLDQLFSCCKELYLVTEAEKKRWHPLPRDRYPKPLIFHDGRLAFKPNPLSTAFMFLWIPFGLALALLRLTIALSLPHTLSTPILSLTSMKLKLKGRIPPSSLSQSKNGHLFVCNHRTLLDPIYVAIAINSSVTAVTYSLSRISELISPIKMIRLTRNREKDGKAMEELLSQGKNLVVCPEGTTCREPYLLRFSPLFAELTSEVVPVALDVNVSIFYATTARGFKGFDAFYYLMNPKVCYEVEFLEKVDTSRVFLGEASSIEMANVVQGVIGKALGFECTKLSRKDKYMVLAENDGSVKPRDQKKAES